MTGKMPVPLVKWKDNFLLGVLCELCGEIY
jgi:hypothetical protein